MLQSEPHGWHHLPHRLGSRHPRGRPHLGCQPVRLGAPHGPAFVHHSPAPHASNRPPHTMTISEHNSVPSKVSYVQCRQQHSSYQWNVKVSKLLIAGSDPSFADAATSGKGGVPRREATSPPAVSWRRGSRRQSVGSPARAAALGIQSAGKSQLTRARTCIQTQITAKGRSS